jgi:hypothetical protein
VGQSAAALSAWLPRAPWAVPEIEEDAIAQLHRPFDILHLVGFASGGTGIQSPSL